MSSPINRSEAKALDIHEKSNRVIISNTEWYIKPPNVPLYDLKVLMKCLLKLKVKQKFRTNLKIESRKSTIVKAQNLITPLINNDHICMFLLYS